jgi:hypothetical protein
MEAALLTLALFTAVEAEADQFRARLLQQTYQQIANAKLLMLLHV